MNEKTQQQYTAKTFSITSNNSSTVFFVFFLQIRQITKVAKLTWNDKLSLYWILINTGQ